MRILLLGNTGQLGWELNRTLLPLGEVQAVDYPEINLAEAEGLRAFVRASAPDVIVNAAAYTAVDRAESEEAAAFRANADGPGILARAAREAGACLLHFSTDFVFSGTKDEDYEETDPVGPAGAYARSKEAGERAVREAGGRHLILRVAWLFGPDGKNFVDTMLRLGRERDRLRVVDDQRGTPTFTRDAAAAAVRALEAGLEGTLHAAGHGPTTWCAFAREALRIAGIRTPVDAITTAEYPTPAARPRNSALRNRVLETTIGDPMRPWTEALREHVLGAAG